MEELGMGFIQPDLEYSGKLFDTEPNIMIVFFRKGHTQGMSSLSVHIEEFINQVTNAFFFQTRLSRGDVDAPECG
jgi:hypothetical protein